MDTKVKKFINRMVKSFDDILNKWMDMILSRNVEVEEETGLGYLRNQAFYKIAIAFAIFGFLPICFGTLMFLREGLVLFGVIQSLIYVLIVLVTISNRIKISKKRMIFVLGYYLLSLMLLLTVGPNGAGFILIVSILAIAGILLNRDQIIGFVIVDLLIFVSLSYLLYSGVLNNMAINELKNSWVIMALTSQASGIILLMIIRSIYQNLEDIAKNLQRSKGIIAESEKQYRSLFESSGVGISYFTSDGHLLSVNRLAAATLGGSVKDFEGKSVYDLFTKEKADLHMIRTKIVMESDQTQEYEDRMVFASGERWVVNTFSRIINDTGVGVQVASLDISKRKKLESDLIYLSNYDFLTGLCNRRFFEEQVREIDQQENLPLSLIMADVNGLKLINDSFGHREGDRLLVESAKLLKSACGGNDIVARIGGGEFAILLPCSDQKEAEEKSSKIIEEMGYALSENSLLSISFGHATKEEVSEDIYEIYVEAENRMHRQKIYESSSMRSKSVDVIMNSLYEKSQRELSHSKRVGWLCAQIAMHMGFPQKRIKLLELAGLVHDIGKIGVDEKILNKPDRLNDHEWEEIKKHPEAGWRILSSVHEFSEIANYILAHHEHWNGSGYPNGLSGEQIPLEARIIAVADAFDAMTSSRSYRDPMEVVTAVSEIKKYAGTQFDPAVVDVFVNQQNSIIRKVDLIESSNFSSIKQSAQNYSADECTRLDLLSKQNDKSN